MCWSQASPAIGSSHGCRRYREHGPRSSCPNSTGASSRYGQGRISRQRFGCSVPPHEVGEGRRCAAADAPPCLLVQRWECATVHFNTQVALTREQHADYFLDMIIEGPHDWTVRPVAEIFYERDIGLFRTRSALVGAIWQVRDNIAVDFAVRGARVNDHTAGEIRTGVTCAFGVPKGPDLLSRLFAMAQHATR